MSRPKRQKKNADPEWLKSIHRELENGTTTGESPKDSHERMPEKSRGENLADSLVLLGVKAEELEDCPKIEHLITPIGHQRIFEYLSGSDDEDAKALLKVRKMLNEKQQRAVPMEVYCVAAGLSTKKVFGLICAEAMDQEEKAKQLLFRVRHTEVVNATIESAMDLEFGSQDRKMLHLAGGFLPTPKNSITFVRQQNVDNRLQGATIVQALPPPEDTIRRLGDRFNDKVMDIKVIPSAEIDEDID